MILQGGQALTCDDKLEYMDLIFPVALYRSLMQRHFLVFIAVATTVLLKLQIVLSSSIFQTTIIQTSRDADVLITSSFHNPWSGMNESEIPWTKQDVYAYSSALEHFDMDLPFGVSPDYAYQTFLSLDLDGVASRPDPQRPITAAVEGLFMDTECLLLEDMDYTVNLTEESLAIAVRFKDCDTTFTRAIYFHEFDHFRDAPGTFWGTEDARNTGSGFLLREDKPCAALPQQHPQFVYYAMVLSPSPHNHSEPQISTIAGVICSSEAWMSTVEIVDDGISPNVSQPADAVGKRVLDVDPWKLLWTIREFEFVIMRAINNAVRPVSWFYEPMVKRSDATDEPVYQSHLLRDTIQAATKRYGPLLAHYELRQEAEERVSRTIMEKVNRLQANLGVCLAMSAIFVVNAISTIYALRQSRKHYNYQYHRDLATLLGSIVYFHGGSGPKRQTSRALEDKKTAWVERTYSPLVLRPWIRILFVVFLLGLIAGLACMLQLSRVSDGLGTLGEGKYWPLLWQSLPALLMLVVSLYSASFDSVIRSLVLLSHVSDQPLSSTKIDVSVLDMLGFRALYYSLKHAIPVVTLTQCLASLSGFLPAVGSVLLVSETLPGFAGVTVLQQSKFVNQTLTSDNIEAYMRTLNDLGQLNVIRDVPSFTSPRNTYFDLAFPTFELYNELGWGPGASARVSTSGAKLDAQCELVPADEYELVEPELGRDDDSLFLSIIQWINCPNGTRKNFTESVRVAVSGPERGSSYFGDQVYSPLTPGQAYRECTGMATNETSHPWYVKTYAWGEFSDARGELERLALWRCNYSWVDVPTEMNVVWSDGSINIDLSKPPMQNTSSSIQPWTPPFNVPVFNNKMLGFETVYVFDGLPYGFAKARDRTHVGRQFEAILEPYGRISSQDLGDPGKDERVLEELNADLAFIAAQLANIEQRADLKRSSDPAPSTGPGHEQRKPINATIADNDRQRVVQNEAVTFILIAILSVVAITHIWALLSDIWRLCLRPDARRPWLLNVTLRRAAPPGFSSVAMMEALLDGSNVSEILPENADVLPTNELHDRLAGKLFRLGWFPSSEPGSSVFTLGVADEECQVDETA